ncbi:hypothetical protein A3C91_03330 [Candidatus Azambacteria bacterium RIFCSPHIGHO2_02_FULL_52_12]|uniref:Putative pre-16S rRNA nuclease n=1 Tax=Candidatus Azambacteria bacterium RIFCSPLOWO2_01_FULL_46_25 TaxID=1797298 RepID=A0A1F5BU58_9BACT|nr:MAG: hypothetical protein A3C91_03330 [Candidatus Azambacteria bacterium RIFCSPHIGHO2_02_FULL_52_12]OGD34122.1 MAG: hypothetical protein A2988_01425 [Candidatus Azambacteria bacterium RIFCSPLOWO2_01_FULL_46_25]OGD36721.1 MAG: hypothetical protein A2850_00380 [Candidatus Azambacteria bacterium RIFCSPHIGHO2_01_FULL_51_74]
MKYLGIDYGEKRIGIAVSDEEGMMAFPRTTLENSPAVLDDIAHLCKEENIQKIVLGVPVSFSGGQSEQAGENIAFGEKLEQHAGIPVVHENEVLSSKMADALGVKPEHRDQSAATIILQSWLDRMRK